MTEMKICRFVEAQTRGAVYKGKVQLTGFEPEYVEVRLILIQLIFYCYLNGVNISHSVEGV